MDGEEFMHLLATWEEANKPPPPPKMDDYRVYYDENGVPTHYTTSNMPGRWVSCTQEQFLAARFDARVVNGVLEYTHNKRWVTKYDRNLHGDVRTSKYDITILVDDGELEYSQWKLNTYDN